MKKIGGSNIMETAKYGTPVEYTMMHDGNTQHIGYSMGERTHNGRLKISETMWDGRCESFDHFAITWRYIGEEDWRD